MSSLTPRIDSLEEAAINKMVMYATASSGTFTIPDNVTKLKVTVIGGGAGGRMDNNSGAFTYGGHGGSTVKYLTGLTPGLTLGYTVGAGGNGTYNCGGGAAGSGPFNGSASSVYSGTQSISTITASGGTYASPSSNAACSGGDTVNNLGYNGYGSGCSGAVNSGGGCWSTYGGNTGAIIFEW